MTRLGSTRHPSIINGVLGPITLGPSSSHLAGPVRIGRLARAAAGGADPAMVTITFNQGGSLAGTYRGHRTDCALVAGLMDYDTDDPRIPDALRRAGQQGISVQFDIAPLDSDHPNAIRLRLSSTRGVTTEVIGTSEGGGAALISHLDGYPVQVDGEYPYLVMVGDPNSLPSLPVGAHRVLTSGDTTTWRLRENLDADVHQSITAHSAIVQTWFLPAVVPAPGPKAADQPRFDSGADLLKQAAQDQLSLADLGLAYEMNRLGWDETAVYREIDRLAQVMRESLERGLNEDLVFSGGITCQGGRPLLEAIEQQSVLSSGVMGRAAAYAMSVNEVNASMGVVAAAPTAGGSGVLPGALLAVLETLDDSDQLMREALLAAGAVGAVFAQRVTFLAELCGCQVEAGAGAAMAAAALVHLRGGTVKQSLEASSIALQNTLGMECDPVAGLMEIPCITRNALCAVNAVIAADLVAIGVPAVIPFDEVLEAVYETGRARGTQCSGTGGLALTPTSLRLAEEFAQRYRPDD